MHRRGILIIIWSKFDLSNLSETTYWKGHFSPGYLFRRSIQRKGNYLETHTAHWPAGRRLQCHSSLWTGAVVGKRASERKTGGNSEQIADGKATRGTKRKKRSQGKSAKSCFKFAQAIPLVRRAKNSAIATTHRQNYQRELHCMFTKKLFQNRNLYWTHDTDGDRRALTKHEQEQTQPWNRDLIWN